MDAIEGVVLQFGQSWTWLSVLEERGLEGGDCARSRLAARGGDVYGTSEWNLSPRLIYFLDSAAWPPTGSPHRRVP